MKTTAIILAGGKGKRMGSLIPKQYIEVNGKPVLYYTINAFEKSSVDEIILVCGSDDREMVRKDIVEKYGFSKVTAIVAGGQERYDSVYNGLCAIKESDYVLIHDGARPFVSKKIIEDSIKDAVMYKACVAGVLVKDTIKRADKDGFVTDTPDRKVTYIIQTPQTFEYELIMKVHRMQQQLKDNTVTDDAMLVEKFSDTRVHIFKSEYENIKLTTIDDMEFAVSRLK